MATNSHQVNRYYPRAQALAAFGRALERNVQQGGIYDTRSAAITVWTLPWDTPAHESRSEIVGTIHVSWSTPEALHATLTALEVEAGHTLRELEWHVRELFGDALPSVGEYQ